MNTYLVPPSPGDLNFDFITDAALDAFIEEAEREKEEPIAEQPTPTYRDQFATACALLTAAGVDPGDIHICKEPIGNTKFANDMQAVTAFLDCNYGINPRTSTMTAVYNIDNDDMTVKLEPLLVHFEEMEGVCSCVGQDINNKNTFGNGINVIFDKHQLSTNKVSAIIFVNGNMTVAGCTTAIEADNAAAFIAKSFQDNPVIERRDVVLVNTDYSVPYIIDCGIAKKQLQELYNIESSVKKGSLRFKLHTGIGPGNKQHISVSLFHTGKIIMTGIVTPMQLLYTAIFVNYFLNESGCLKPKVEVVKEKKRCGRKRKSDVDADAGLLDMLL